MASILEIQGSGPIRDCGLGGVSLRSWARRVVGNSAVALARACCGRRDMPISACLMKRGTTVPGFAYKTNPPGGGNLAFRGQGSGQRICAVPCLPGSAIALSYPAPKADARRVSFGKIDIDFLGCGQPAGGRARLHDSTSSAPCGVMAAVKRQEKTPTNYY